MASSGSHFHITRVRSGASTHLKYTEALRQIPPGTEFKCSKLAFAVNQTTREAASYLWKNFKGYVKKSGDGMYIRTKKKIEAEK